MSRFTTPISTNGPNGNIFAMTATAGRFMRKLGMPPEEIDAFYKKVTHSGSYAEACAVIEEYFPIDWD